MTVGDVTTTTNRHGGYVAAGVTPGPATVSADAGDLGAGSAKVAAVTAGSVAKAGPIRVPGTQRMHDVSGTVTDADGQPLAGATVTLDGGSDTAVTTGEDGTFRFDDVPAGARSVTATKDGHLSGTDAAVKVRFGETASPTLRLARSIAVANPGFEEPGDAGESSLAGWQVKAEPEAAAVRQDRTGFGGAHEGSYGLSLWSDDAFTADVSQRIDGLKAGRYVARAATYSGMTGTLRLEVRDDSGRTIAEREAPRSDNYVFTGIDFTLPQDGAVTIAIVADGNAADWAVVDAVELGYRGMQTAQPGTPDNPDVPGEPGTPGTPADPGDATDGDAADGEGRKPGTAPGLSATGADVTAPGLAALTLGLAGLVLAVRRRRAGR